MDKIAGLTTQIRNLRKRLDAIDTSKGNPSEVKAIVEAISALEDRLEKHTEAKKKRKLEKETKAKESLEVSKVADEVPAAPAPTPAPGEGSSVMETKCEGCGKPLGGEAFLSKWPVCGSCTRKRHKKVTRGEDAKPEVKKESEGGDSLAAPTIEDKVDHKDPDHFCRQCLPVDEKDLDKLVDNDMDHAKEEDAVIAEAAPAKAMPPLEAPRYEIKDDAPRREYKPMNIREKEHATRRMEMKNAPHIISEMPKEGQFELDAKVEPKHGKPGSVGTVMRHDHPNADVFVVWDKDTNLGKLHGYGQYSPQDLRKVEHLEAALDKSATANGQVIEMFINDSFPKDKMPVWGTANLKIKKYPQGWALVNYATPIMYRDSAGDVFFNTQRYSQTTLKIQKEIRNALGGRQANEVDEGGIFQAMNHNEALEPKVPAAPVAVASEPSGVGYGGDRPGVNVAPMRDEDTSLNAAKSGTCSDKSGTGHAGPLVKHQHGSDFTMYCDKHMPSHIKHNRPEPRATLTKDLSNLKVGQTVNVLKIDVKTKSVKYASLNGMTKGWAPLSYFNISASVEKMAIVVHENGKWLVKSQEGATLGTYGSQDEADKRLREVEYFKSNKAALRLSRFDKVAAEVATQPNFSELTQHIEQMRERITTFQEGLNARASAGPDPENKDFQMLIVDLADLKKKYADVPEAMDAIGAIERDLAECGISLGVAPKVEAAVGVKADMPPKPTNDPGLNMMWFYDDTSNTWEVKPKQI